MASSDIKSRLPDLVLPRLLDSEYTELIKNTLEAHTRSQLDPKKAEEQAYAWLSWARGRKHVKVTSSDIPDGVLPEGVQGVLHDVKVFMRRGPDDMVYDNHPDIRQKVARGNCFVMIMNGKDPGLRCAVYALKKFTGGLGDDDDREAGGKKIWKQYFTKSMDHAKIVVATRKANGEAAHLSARKIAGEVYLCVGSKNVHLLMKNRADIDKYTEDRFVYAKEIAHTILDLVDNMEETAKARLLEFLCDSEMTAVMEMLSPAHQHVEDFSHMTKTELRFITWTNCRLETLDTSLCCMPPHVGIDIAQSLGLPTVQYEMVAMDELDDRLRKVRQGYGYEGEVLYFLDSNSDVIGLLKKKTIWYILCRATREKLRGSCAAYEKNPNGFSVEDSISRLERRYTQIKQWLSLDGQTTDEWKSLGIKCLQWCISKLQSGDLKSTDIADLFPVTWKKYLTETNRSDHIIARNYDDAKGNSLE